MPAIKQHPSSKSSPNPAEFERTQLWTDISHAARVAKCFADSDFDSNNELDAELLKFQPLWTFTTKKHRSYNTTAQSVDWLPLDDNVWELAFTKEAAEGRKRRRSRPGIRVVGLEPEQTDDEDEDEDGRLSAQWQVVDAAQDTDFVLIRSLWQNDLWTAISKAAKTQGCFLDTDYNSFGTLDGEQAKFNDLYDMTMTGCDQETMELAGSPEWVRQDDKAWVLTFVHYRRHKSSEVEASKRTVRKRWCTGTLVEDHPKPDGLTKHWQLVNGMKIPAHDELDKSNVGNGYGKGEKRSCAVM